VNHPSPRLSRRKLLAGCAGLPLLAPGCAPSAKASFDGEVVGAAESTGHALRDGALAGIQASVSRSVGVLIVGAGVAGLSAAWRLARAGFDDFVVLEIEPRAGGTAASGSRRGQAYPYGAHYLPLPLADNQALLVLLDEMGLLEGVDARGQPMAREEHLCRDPHERVFDAGAWHEGLFPEWRAAPRDIAQFNQFQAAIADWVGWRDGKGRRAFTLPTARCSDDAEVLALDQISMQQWLHQRGLNSELLLWYVDYACRDDYGLTAAQTSAWAGLFYFAARVDQPGQEPRPYLTWPEGNGRLVTHLAAAAEGRLLKNHAAFKLQPVGGAVDVMALSGAQRVATRYRARRVIFAAPQFLAPYLIEDLPADRRAAAGQFTYGAWLTANLFLTDRPRERGFPLAWDNVLFESRSLGYVVATHQALRDHGPTVFTWYCPLLDDDPKAARVRLQSMSWQDCAAWVLDDLLPAHPDLRGLVERVEVMKFGHAMVRPRPGFITCAARKAAATPYMGLHFAHADLSGVPLFEEAFLHGVRAAEEALSALGVRVDSLISAAPPASRKN